MGFWSKVGKFAGKTALGIIAPGALAGYEYQKAKETNEILKGFDEAIEMLFKSLAQLKEGDSLSELLVRARSLVVKILSDEDAREPILKEIHPNEQGRAICLIMTSALANPEVARVLSPSEDDRTFLAGVLGIIEAHCQQLDAKIAGRGLATMEESVLRMLYDYVCTRMAHVEIIMFANRNNDEKATFDAQMSDMIFPSEEDEETQIAKDLCTANRVSYYEIKRKMGY